MITHPTAAELVEAVAAWLPGEGGAFAMRVARNALETAARELRLGPAAQAAAAARMAELLGEALPYDEANALLAERIRSGEIAWDDSRLLDHLHAIAQDMLAIDQPRYRSSV